jgi:hypothetical protein
MVGSECVASRQGVAIIDSWYLAREFTGLWSRLVAICVVVDSGLARASETGETGFSGRSPLEGHKTHIPPRQEPWKRNAKSQRRGSQPQCGKAYP